MRRPFLISGFIGLGVIVISLVMMISGPASSGQLSEGFFTPIIAFEFATTPEEIYGVFPVTETGINGNAIEATMTNTIIDFLFLIVYGAFLFTFSWECRRISGNRLFYLSSALALLAPLFDILENFQLLSIMNELLVGNINGEFEPELSYLAVFTWLKWGALALYFAMLYTFLLEQGRFGRIIAIFAILPTILGVTAFVFRPAILIELFALSITVMFVLLIIFSFTYRERTT